MNTVGPSPLASIQRSEEPSLTFRANQRITADVIQIATDHVVLEIQGIQVVGRLSSQDQAALLAERQMAQFIVRGLQGQTPILQLVTNAPAESAAATPGSAAADLLPHLLEMAGLPNDAATTAIARALIGRGLPVSKELVEELRGMLSGINQWGDQQAAAAALLKASGLPVSKASIELVAGNGLQDWVDTAVALRSHLQTLAASGKLDPELARTVQDAVRSLTTLLVRWDGSPESIADALQRAVQLAGKSIEHELANQIQKGGGSSGQEAPSLLDLANLRRELVRAGAGPMVGELDRFLEGMRVMHLFNVQPQQMPARGQWLSIDLPIGVPVPGETQPGFGPDQHFAKLRVAYRAEGDDRKIDSGSTRLVIQADVEGGETIEVDLSVIANTIGARVTASSEALRGAAETEMPSLREGLETLGYSLQSTVYDVGGPTPIITLDEPASKVALSEINIRA